MNASPWAAAIAAGLFVATAAACSAASGDATSGGGGATAGTGGGTSGTGTSGTAVTSGGGGAADDGGLIAAPIGDAAPAVGEVYGHSDTTLFKLEPISKTVTTIGGFDCITISAPGSGEGMWDIALDKDGQM